MLILFHGGDSYASWQNLMAELKKAGREPRIVYGDEIRSFNEIAAGAQNFSFFENAPRATVIRRLSENKSKILLKEIEEKLGAGYKDTLYCWEDSKLDKYSPLIKLAQKLGRVNETRTPSSASINKFVLDYLNKEGLQIKQNIMDELLLLLPQSKNGVVNELDKLVMLLHSDGSKEIKKDHLSAVTINVIENQVWDLTDAISRKDKNGALKLINKLYNRNEDYPLIVGSLANQLELLYLLKEDVSLQTLLGKFKLHPFIIEKNRRNAEKFTKDQLKMLFQKLTSLDFNVKQGKIDGKLGLNLLITTL